MPPKQSPEVPEPPMRVLACRPDSDYLMLRKPLWWQAYNDTWLKPIGYVHFPASRLCDLTVIPHPRNDERAIELIAASKNHHTPGQPGN